MPEPGGQAQAVIFDIEGVLVDCGVVDSEPNYFEAQRMLLTEYGILVVTPEMKRPLTGMDTREMLTEVSCAGGSGTTLNSVPVSTI